MKWQPFWLGWTGLAIALSSTPILSQPSYAEDSVRFRCQKEKDGGNPTTIIEVSSTGRERVRETVFHWYRAFPSSPARAEQLCQQVSTRLQTQVTNIPHLSFGLISNGESTDRYGVCLTKKPDEDCNSTSTILFVLEPTDDPAFVKAQLLPARVLDQSSIRIHNKIRLTIFGFRLSIE